MGGGAGNAGKVVVNIDGDGSFVMNSQELATCYESRLAVKTVILNNGGHGMVRQWQEIIYGGRFRAIDLSASPDFVKLADAYGGGGIRPTKPSQAVPAPEKAVSTPGPAAVALPVENDDRLLPPG